MSEKLVVTVTQVNKRLAYMLKSDKALQNISVRGEISNFTNHYKTGHLYFTLKDEETSIRCVMFRWNAEKLNIVPENGMKAVVEGSVQVFERDGVYQIYACDIKRDGIGDLYAAFEELKKRLGDAGYFAQKRPLPEIPGKICIITSETGAALQDMLNIISRRFPVVKITLIPALVQGANAPQSIVNALRAAQNTGADVIIFGRGGGSIEDLWAFNDENVAKAIFNSRIPTISAVGHETDFTIADFAADLRAPTPSAAAELAVPDISVFLASVNNIIRTLNKRVLDKIEACEAMASAKFKTIYSPRMRINSAEENMNNSCKRICISFNNLIGRKTKELLSVMEVISALDPMKILARGFSVTYNEKNEIVTNAGDLKLGDNIRVKLSLGEIRAEIKEINNDV